MAVWKKLGLVLLSVSIFALGGYGLYRAMRSPLFLVKVVEVSELPEKAPISPEEITRLAGIPVGELNLFDLPIDRIRKRVESHLWVRRARILKRFPHTVAIEVDFREPRALLRTRKGALRYVDRDGRVFAALDLEYRADLTVLSGFEPENQGRIRTALEILELWDKSGLRRHAELSSLTYGSPRGFEGLITYRLGGEASGSSGSFGRSRLIFGAQRADEVPGLQLGLGRVEGVLQYLRSHGISARQISADIGKKIVVKIAPAS